MAIAGKYRLIRELTEGGFGLIYEAVHTKLTRDPKRAIKVIKQEYVDSEELQARFAREVQVTSALSQMNNHIVRIYDDFGEVPNFGHFFVMEFLEGQSLTDMLEHHNHLIPLDLCYHLFAQLCDAIHAAHSEGVVHRDLKPENLLIISRLREPHFLKVIDFGIARPTESDSRMTQLTQGALGTPEYMSPEQCLNKGIDERTDIYAMGIILFELLAGHTPFVPRKDGVKEHKAMMEILTAHMMSVPPNLMTVMPEGRQIPQALADVVAKALAKIPEDRFATVEEMETAFKEAVFNSRKPVTSNLASPPSATPVYVPELASSEIGITAPPPSSVEIEAKTIISPGMNLPTGAAMVPNLPSGELEQARPQPSDNKTTNVSPAHQPPLQVLETQPDLEPYTTRSGPPWGIVATVLVLLLAGGGWWMYQKQASSSATSNSSKTTSRSKPRRVKPRQPRIRPRPRPSIGSPIRKTVVRMRTIAPVTPRRLEVLQPRARPSAIRYIPPRRRVFRRRVNRRRRRVRRKRSRWYRPVRGCPRTSYFWVYIQMTRSQRNQVILNRYRGPKAKIVKLSNGNYCVGVRSKATKVQFKGVRDPFYPCHFRVWKRPKRIQVKLTLDGEVITSDRDDACIQR